MGTYIIYLSETNTNGNSVETESLVLTIACTISSISNTYADLTTTKSVNYDLFSGTIFADFSDSSFAPIT